MDERNDFPFHTDDMIRRRQPEATAIPPHDRVGPNDLLQDATQHRVGLVSSAPLQGSESRKPTLLSFEYDPFTILEELLCDKDMTLEALEEMVQSLGGEPVWPEEEVLRLGDLTDSRKLGC